MRISRTCRVAVLFIRGYDVVKRSVATRGREHFAIRPRSYGRSIAKICTLGRTEFNSQPDENHDPRHLHHHRARERVLLPRSSSRRRAAEKAAVIANDRAFEAAYAKADVKALADFFAEDAEYTTDDGRTFSGRAQIEDAIRAGLLARKGAKLAINVDTVRVLAPERSFGKGHDDRDIEERRGEHARFTPPFT